MKPELKLKALAGGLLAACLLAGPAMATPDVPTGTRFQRYPETSGSAGGGCKTISQHDVYGTLSCVTTYMACRVTYSNGSATIERLVVVGEQTRCTGVR